ncbi:MAG: hypothetical protein LBF94_00060 [Puniceicoccales bacterium]|jgi:hypothetical protein|nr:hypothetical protein [Puniceicoccales bacterium]
MDIIKKAMEYGKAGMWQNYPQSINPANVDKQTISGCYGTDSLLAKKGNKLSFAKFCRILKDVLLAIPIFVCKSVAALFNVIKRPICIFSVLCIAVAAALIGAYVGKANKASVKRNILKNITLTQDRPIVARGRVKVPYPYVAKNHIAVGSTREIPRLVIAEITQNEKVTKEVTTIPIPKVNEKRIAPPPSYVSNANEVSAEGNVKKNVAAVKDVPVVVMEEVEIPCVPGDNVAVSSSKEETSSLVITETTQNEKVAREETTTPISEVNEERIALSVSHASNANEASAEGNVKKNVAAVQDVPVILIEEMEAPYVPEDNVTMNIVNEEKISHLAIARNTKNKKPSNKAVVPITEVDRERVEDVCWEMESEYSYAFERTLRKFFSKHPVTDITHANGHCTLKLQDGVFTKHSVLCNQPKIVLESATDDEIIFSNGAGIFCPLTIESLLP